MLTISGPNRICKKFRGFKRALKVRIGDSSGGVTVGKGGWDGEPTEEGGWRRQSGRQRWSEELPSTPATPAPCLALSNSPAGCSGADYKSALLPFPTQDGGQAPNTKPDQGVGVQEPFHSMYSRKSSSGSSKSGEPQKVPGRAFHRPALARVGSVGTSSSSAFTLIFRCCHLSGIGS